MNKLFVVMSEKNGAHAVVHRLPDGRTLRLAGTKDSCEDFVKKLSAATRDAFADFAKANRKHQGQGQGHGQGHGHHGNG